MRPFASAARQVRAWLGASAPRGALALAFALPFSLPFCEDGADAGVADAGADAAPAASAAASTSAAPASSAASPADAGQGDAAVSDASAASADAGDAAIQATDATFADAATTRWSYGGETGAVFWASLNPDWSACGGADQSPVDLPSEPAAPGKDFTSVSLDYLPFMPLVSRDGTSGVSLHNRANNYAMLGAERFELLRVDLRSPSEHTLAGQHFELEAQLVHAASGGELLIVALLFDAGDERNPLLDLALAAGPGAGTAPGDAGAKKPLDLRPLVQLSGGYYGYVGSTTTPPCRGDVRWIVLRTRPRVKTKQTEAYRALVGGRSNRPVMPLGKRTVWAHTP